MLIYSLDDFLTLCILKVAWILLACKIWIRAEIWIPRLHIRLVQVAALSARSSVACGCVRITLTFAECVVQSEVFNSVWWAVAVMCSLFKSVRCFNLVRLLTENEALCWEKRFHTSVVRWVFSLKSNVHCLSQEMSFFANSCLGLT